MYFVSMYFTKLSQYQRSLDLPGSVSVIGIRLLNLPEERTTGMYSIVGHRSRQCKGQSKFLKGLNGALGVGDGGPRLADHARGLSLAAVMTLTVPLDELPGTGTPIALLIPVAGGAEDARAVGGRPAKVLARLVDPVAVDAGDGLVGGTRRSRAELLFALLLLLLALRLTDHTLLLAGAQPVPHHYILTQQNL